MIEYYSGQSYNSRKDASSEVLYVTINSSRMNIALLSLLNMKWFKIGNIRLA